MAPKYVVFVSEGRVATVRNFATGKAVGSGTVEVIDYDSLGDGQCPVCLDRYAYGNYAGELPPAKCPGCGFDLRNPTDAGAIQAIKEKRLQ